MDLTKLNSLAETHKQLQSDESFRELYEEARVLFLRIHISQTVRGKRGDEHDAEAAFDDAVVSLASRDDVVCFGEALSAALRIKRSLVGRGNARRENRYKVIVDRTQEHDDGSSTAMFDLTDSVSTEDIVINSLTQKKDAQKRQLLSSLIDPDKVDHDTTLIVSQFSQHDSVAALAKALGMHHEFVKRKIRKLSRRYDANRFGDVNEYLAV